MNLGGQLPTLFGLMDRFGISFGVQLISPPISTYALLADTSYWAPNQELGGRIPSEDTCKNVQVMQ
jgi:hypothetical protein